MRRGMFWGTPLTALLIVQLTPPAQAGSYTMSDSKLSATISTDPGKLGLLTELRQAGAGARSVVESDANGSLWSAGFVGTGSGISTVFSESAVCNTTGSAIASQHGSSPNALRLDWTGCVVPLAGGRAIGGTVPGLSWTQHKDSNCGGRCLAKDSGGPRGGHCDRMPGCGHDAGLPYCDPVAMKARCRNASNLGCTAFNTNGYLYAGNSAEPFTAYPLDCYTYGPPPPPAATVDVSMLVTLRGGLLEYEISFSGDGRLSLWEYTISVPNLVVGPDTQVAKTSAAKQMLGLYDTSDPHVPAVYFAAHDPVMNVKTCQATVGQSGLLSCTVLGTNATLPLEHYHPDFPIALTVLDGDWWDIASMYRSWVVESAQWTRLGPLDRRSDLPEWLENITLWVNNNWGGDPLLPNYGGNPEHVQLEMIPFSQVLELQAHGGILALHWYEWDTLGYALGSNHTNCDRHPAPCGFDTHYPDYFPARVGCKEAIEAMRRAGMRVIPYINGQLFDTLTPRWNQENASLATQKYAEQTMKTGTSQPALSPHLEHFDGITSAVMCPATAYWSKVMSDTIIRAVNELGFDGVYVDQVGNGEQRNCADPSHGHSINGGSFWADAFDAIMSEVRSKVHSPSMFMTEGIVEEVSGARFDILLGLQWTELPYWSAIYGGYELLMSVDYMSNPRNWLGVVSLCSGGYGYATGHATTGPPLDGGLVQMLTSQFMVGGTMGWFTYQDQGAQFYDPANSMKVAYIRKLSEARIAAKHWMVHGRATRSLKAPASTGSAELQAACFLRDRQHEPASVICAIALPANMSAVSYHLQMEPALYGLAVPSTSKVVLSDLLTGTTLGTFKGNVSYVCEVQAYTVKLLKLASSL